jgi:hypothetical protein
VTWVIFRAVRAPRFVVALAVAAFAVAVGSRPAAAQSCADLPSPLYVPGTTDVKPFLTRVAPRLATAAGDDQMTIVYQAIGSCTATDYVLGGDEIVGTAVYWTGEVVSGVPVEESCTLAAGTRADLALSDVTVRTCTGADIPAGIGEFPSMVQGFGLVVPQNSSQQAITAAEGYFLFKFGGEAGRQVPPWTDPAFIAIRTPAASTQLLIGLAVGVPGTMWSANLTNIHGGSSGVVSAVAAENATGNADRTLGVLSLQRYDENRDTLKMLAFESYGQSCLGAVYPDSTATALDKRNLRDGHYSIWGYLWAVAAVDGSGDPAGARARRFIEFLGGTEPINGADPIADTALAGAVPACAMEVSRAFDGAPLERHEPPEPCGCYFESVVTGASVCTACSEENPCSSGVCRFGFCEAR